MDALVTVEREHLLLRWFSHYSYWVFSALFLLGPSLFSEPTKNRCAYAKIVGLGLNRARSIEREIVKSYGTDMPISRAMESEGSDLADVTAFHFDFKPITRTKLRQRLAEEEAGTKPPELRAWLKAWWHSYRPTGYRVTPSMALNMTPKQILTELLKDENILSGVTLEGKDDLIEAKILSFNDLEPTSKTPKWLAVGDDHGSYELRSRGGEANRTKYHEQRDTLETSQEKSVGHQHIVHAWPDDPAIREKIAPQYIELLDSTSWFLYFRQLLRDPNETDIHVMDFYVQGIYPRNALDQLHSTVVENRPEDFNKKYFMVGARAFKADPTKPGQEDRSHVVSWELRSGNSAHDRRDFLEDMIEARLSTGDYSGIADYRTHQFNPNAPIRELANPFLSEDDIKALEEFETLHGPLKYSAHGNALNTYRNRILVPLLPWQNRLALGPKTARVAESQKLFADKLAALARQYNPLLKKATPAEKKKLEAEITKQLLAMNWHFAERTRLDEDFKEYIAPKPTQIADINIPVSPRAVLDPNQIDMGIEFSFRFPYRPDNKAEADALLKTAAETIRDELGGGKVTKLDDGGHGHGLSIRYRVEDTKGQTWRVEWDGVVRSYDEDGKAHSSQGGHAEVPTPKKVPDMKEIQALYHAMDKLNLHPKRIAGGGHVNIDLTKLYDLPPKEGARKLANLIAYFESNREMISYLWQHPARERVAIPVDYDQAFIDELNTFKGDWDELAYLLYYHGYFNEYVTRKPGYTQFNITNIIAPMMQKPYKAPIDIKNPTQRWFPSFGDKGNDRVEFRLFDAPPREDAAALQIKYTRALLNAAWNKREVVPLYPHKYAADSSNKWQEHPRSFYDAAVKHLESLGLDPNEFAPIIAQATSVQSYVPLAKPEVPEYQRWALPDYRGNNPKVKKRIEEEEEEGR